MTTALSPALRHVHDHPVFGIHILPNQILKHNEGFHEEILWRTVEEGFEKQAHSQSVFQHVDRRTPILGQCIDGLIVVAISRKHLI